MIGESRPGRSSTGRPGPERGGRGKREGARATMMSTARNDRPGRGVTEPGAGAILAALGLALAGVALTRWPVARPGPFDSDERGYLQTIAIDGFPMFHTLFLAL